MLKCWPSDALSLDLVGVVGGLAVELTCGLICTVAQIEAGTTRSYLGKEGRQAYKSYQEAELRGILQKGSGHIHDADVKGEVAPTPRFTCGSPATQVIIVTRSESQIWECSPGKDTCTIRFFSFFICCPILYPSSIRLLSLFYLSSIRFLSIHPLSLFYSYSS